MKCRTQPPAQAAERANRKRVEEAVPAPAQAGDPALDLDVVGLDSLVEERARERHEECDEQRQQRAAADRGEAVQAAVRAAR
jgi:hypothetical protein